MPNANPDLVMEKRAILVALEQLDKLLIRTMNIEMRENVSEIYAIINSYDVEYISVAGVMFNLMSGAKHAKFTPSSTPPQKNSFEIGGIMVHME